MVHPAKYAWLLLVALLASGCATTYIPVSWGMGDRVQRLSHSDPMLATLFDRYDPQRTTLRVSGASFNEVMMPSEVSSHLGAYRLDTRQIYRNLADRYNDRELRDLMLHELAHHIWFTAMSKDQRTVWGLHLTVNPSPLQDMVRRSYRSPSQFASEDFAFTVEYARPVDIRELTALGIITPAEGKRLLAALSAEERLTQIDVSPSAGRGAPPAPGGALAR